MSQSSLPVSASFGSSPTFSWFSDETLQRFVPGFRAVVDALLIFFGGVLAFLHLSVAKHLFGEINTWECAVYLVINLLLGLLGLVIAYCTARSSHWQDRQRVLVCLSLALLLYGAMSSLGLWIQEYPEAVRCLLLAVSATAAATLICIGLISIEQRLRSAINGAELPERVASKRQCFWRIFYGMLFCILTIFCLALPFIYYQGTVNGSFLRQFENVYGCEISFWNYFCLFSLCVYFNVNYLMLAILSWLYLQNFHQQIVPSFREKTPPKLRPLLSASMVFVGGAVVHILLFAIFHPGPDVAPWVLLVTTVCALVCYKKASAKAGDELKQDFVA